MARSRRPAAAGADPRPIVTYSHVPTDMAAEDDRVEPRALDADASIIDAVEVPLVATAEPVHRARQAPDLRAPDLRADVRDDAFDPFEDGPIAAAYGIDSRRMALVLAGGCAALAGVAGVCLALTFTLTPSQIFAWVGVVFAAVMLGGLGSALGPLAAGIVIGVSEAITMAVASPSWAPIVSFSLLILMLLFRPGKA